MISAHTILGVTEKATQQEIQYAYKQMVKKHHPDRQGDNHIFILIQKAYEHLTGTPHNEFVDHQSIEKTKTTKTQKPVKKTVYKPILIQVPWKERIRYSSLLVTASSLFVSFLFNQTSNVLALSVFCLFIWLMTDDEWFYRKFLMSKPQIRKLFFKPNIIEDKQYAENFFGTYKMFNSENTKLDGIIANSLRNKTHLHVFCDVYVEESHTMYMYVYTFDNMFVLLGTTPYDKQKRKDIKTLSSKLHMKGNYLQIVKVENDSKHEISVKNLINWNKGSFITDLDKLITLSKLVYRKR